MSMIRGAGIGLALTAVLAVGPAFAENPGVTAAPILQMPLGARAVAMGSAFTAVANDASALYFNPAGLSTLMSKEVTFMYLKGLEDKSVEYIAGATPISFSGLIGTGYTSVAASILFSQNGDIEVNRTRSDGSFLSSENLSAGGDLVATVGYSERVFENTIDTPREEFHINQSFGLAGKLIRSTLAEQYSATAFAGDIGYLVEAPEVGMNFGVAILNFGTKMTFIESGDPLPLTFRTGFAFSPRLPERLTVPAAQELQFAVDGEILPDEERWHANLGMEYRAMRLYALRLGYQLNRDIAGLTMGFGARWRGFSVDYAWAMNDALSDVHRFSFTYRFGHVPAYKREFIRRPFIESMPEREELREMQEETPRTLEPARRPRRNPGNDGAAPGWIY